jgi:site-specific recombinase XerD
MIKQTEKVKKMISDGSKAEDLFEYVMKMLRRPIKRSSTNQNKYQHIDFFIGDKSYDVKSRRDQNTVWLEAKGIYGHDGWLLGKATYIVIYYIELQEFVFYLREDLVKFARKFTKKSKVKRYYRWYTRENWGRKDACLLVKKSDLLQLEIQTITITDV